MFLKYVTTSHYIYIYIYRDKGPKIIYWALGLGRGRWVVRGQLNSSEDVRL